MQPSLPGKALDRPAGMRTRSGREGPGSPGQTSRACRVAGEIQLPHAWTAVSDQTGAYFVEVACLALAECRLKGFKQHVQARDRSAAHTSRTKTRPSRCLNGAAAADAQVLQQRSNGSSTRQVQGMPAGSPSCRFQGEDGEPRRTSAQHHEAVATVVEARAVS